MAVERRQYERKHLRTSGQLFVAGRPPMEVRTIDLSLGGLALAAPMDVPAKTLCVVRVVLPLKPKGNVLLEARARVVHSVLSSAQAGFSIGLQFTDVSAATAAALNQFLGA
jgi:c-di-GMP-binding flagellar brake protein YcgR